MDDALDNIDWLQYIRKCELESVMKYLSPKNGSILEIGGKDGFQAGILSKQGFAVVSIDSEPSSQQYFQVKKMDATNLEFDNETFDIIFSSHVIAHINNQSLALSEMSRVLKNDGVLILVVPTPWWVLVTSFWHYILLPKSFRNKMKSDVVSDNSTKSASGKNNKTFSKRLINHLFLHPLGVNPSFVHEFYYFSRGFWKKMFIKNGFVVSNFENGPILYSGHGVCKLRFLSFRKSISSTITSSYCFVLKKIKDSS